MITSRRRLFVVVLVLVATIAALHVIGARAGLALADWSMWTSTATEMTTGVLRLLALALSYYLLVVAVAVALLGERLGENRFARFIPYGTLAAAGLVAGVGLLSSTTTTPSAAQQSPSAPLVLQPSEAPLVLQPMGSPDTPTPDLSTDARLNRSATQAESSEPTWTVKSGESFWVIATETLADEWGVSDLTDTEIVSYWEPLIAANQDRLVDPGNPDLLLPDQELLLPPIPAMEREAN